MSKLSLADYTLARVLVDTMVVPGNVMVHVLRHLDSDGGSLIDYLRKHSLASALDLADASAVLSSAWGELIDAELLDLIRRRGWPADTVKTLEMHRDLTGRRLSALIADHDEIPEAARDALLCEAEGAIELRGADALTAARRVNFKNLVGEVDETNCEAPTEISTGASGGNSDPVLRPPASRKQKRAELASQRFPGQVVSERYLIGDLIGLGGMGAVFQARDLQTKQLLALKVLDSDRPSPENLSRFEREVLVASAFDHPRIVAVKDAGETNDGAPFLVMDYVEGHSLANLIAIEGFLELPRALRFTEALLEALEYVHSRQVLHRDIKPGNILIGPKEELRLTDFGLARPLDYEAREAEVGHTIFRTLTGLITGTPSYMSPEAIRAQRCDERSDLYAVGLVLHEMLTGKRPFEAHTKVSQLKEHLFAEPVSLSNDEFPLGVVIFVDRLLAKRPTDRPENATVALDELRMISA